MAAKQRKAIAFVITDAVSFNVLMRGQLEFFASHDVDISLLCGGGADEIQRLRERKVGRVVPIPFKRRPSLFVDLLCLCRLSSHFLRFRYDAVVFSTPKAMLVGALASWLTLQPLRVAVVRGRAYEKAQGWKRRFYLALDRLVFYCASRLIFISHSLADAYALDGLRSNQSEPFVLGSGSSNGVDLCRFKPSEGSPVRRTLLEKNDIDGGKFVVLIAGRLTPDKGSCDAIDLTQRLSDRPDIVFVFVGSCEDERLAERIGQLDSGRVRHMEFTSELETWFQSADLHLFLSHREGFGNVALEAAASNLPTFGYDVVGVRDSVTDGVTGRLFAFGDLDAIASAIAKAADDRAGFRERFSRSRDFVADRFAREAVWRRYAEAYGIAVGEVR